MTWLRRFRSDALNRASDALSDLAAAVLIMTTFIVIILLCVAAVRWAWGVAT